MLERASSACGQSHSMRKISAHLSKSARVTLDHWLRLAVRLARISSTELNAKHTLICGSWAMMPSVNPTASCQKAHSELEHRRSGPVPLQAVMSTVA